MQSQGVKLMVGSAIILVAVIVAIYFGLQFFTDKKFREHILRNKPRLDDVGYLREMSFLNDEKDIHFALQFRTAFASIANLPRECISPEMLIVDLFRAQSFIFSDGIDLAEIAMELEDQLNVEIAEDSLGFPVTDDDTVMTLTGKLIEYAHMYWQTA